MAMRKSRLYGCVSLAVVFCAAVIGVLAAPVSHAEVSKETEFRKMRSWIRETAPIPFSFVYGEKPSIDLLRDWTVERSVRDAGDRRREETATWTDPVTRLEVRLTATEYLDFAAVEWVLSFTNGGKQDTPVLEDVQALDAQLPGASAGDGWKVFSTKGSQNEAEDFKPSLMTIEGKKTFAPCHGRSSDGVAPFFNLFQPNGGVVLAVGWTGQWASSFEPSAEGGLRMRAGMERTHLTLHPGESIRTPSILLVFWEGDQYLRGNNLLRSALYEHYYPKAGGKPAPLPVAASPHLKIAFEGTTEENMLRTIDNIVRNKLPVDTYWIDAGWYTCPDNNWAKGVGNWEPDPVRFPRGLKPIGDAAHAGGLKFLLWFEPERVMRGTWTYEHHRDWLLSPQGLPAELMYHEKDGFYLLNLGNDDARQWVTDKISGMLDEARIDVYRQDFNMTPLYYWRNGEPENRQGMNEIRHITGLYRLYDDLLRRHPGLLIDTCASGGRRIDIEMLRRSVFLFKSDYVWHPDAQQGTTFGLSHWMPVFGIGAIDVEPYAFRSGIGLNMTCALDYLDDPGLWERAARAFSQYKALRPLFAGDFYPLTEYSVDGKDWIAWQIHSGDKGLVQAFRRKDAAAGEMRLRLNGLEPQAVYEIENIDAGSISGEGKTRLGGDALLKTGLPAVIGNSPGAAIMTYRKVSP